MTTPFRSAVLFCVVFGLMTSQATAATRYVSPGGSGTSCTQTTPCGSMSQAYRTAAPGDTVQLAAGSYGGQSIDKDATKPLGSAPVVFQAAGATLASFITRANDVQYFDVNVPSDVVLVRAGQNVLIERAKAQKPYIWGPRPGVDPGDRINNVTIKDGNFGPHTSCEGGFQITADGPPKNVKIIGNYFHDFQIDASCPSAHLDCMHVFNGIDGLTVSGNRFARCEHFGILLNGSSNVVIENNFLSGGIYGFKLRGDTDPSWEQFNNVTIRNNSADEISLGSDGSNTLTNVRVENNATVDYVQCRSGATFANNLAQRGGRCTGDFANVASIGFADMSNGDFHIASTSPAANRVATGGPATDFDGNARPQGTGFEVGADEIVQGGSPPPPPPPPAACADGLDNDGDLLVDLADPGCTSSSDTDETNPAAPPPPPPPPPAACADGLDNDGDLLVDMLDPGCSSSTDTDETDPVAPPPPPAPLPACGDGIDNDGDLLVDMADPGCISRLDDSEANVVNPPPSGGGGGGKSNGKKKPKPTLAVSVYVPTQMSVSSTGVLKVRVSCPKAKRSGGVKRCAGKLLVLRPRASAAGSHRRVVGSARFRIRAGHAKVIRVHLSRLARASSSRRYILRVKMRRATRNVRARPVRIDKRVSLLFLERRGG
jgi:Right handed beta helix region